MPHCRNTDEALAGLTIAAQSAPVLSAVAKQAIRTESGTGIRGCHLGALGSAGERDADAA